ncbi:Prefoldin_subunit 4 [Hexamita inflata]|uniref:Prefoldin subunit 4 n=1 Tax=Hexamita inflata TaxID=28002 RepID=A0AA86UY49_9EUKA|nr:Prefoldin subunit 4 [Hexamita inflata]
MSLLPENTPIVEVTKDDQYQIAAFSRNHMKYENLVFQLNSIVKYMDELESASIGLMDCDDSAMLQIGTGFIEGDSTDLDTIVGTRVEYYEGQKAKLEAEIEQTKKILDKLRVVLVGKFGNAINLSYEKK